MQLGTGDEAVDYIFGVTLVKKADDDWSVKGLGHSTFGPVEEHAVAYDAKQRQGILFGGRWENVSNSKTMLWNGDGWTEKTAAPSPSTRASHTMTYDAKRENVVLFGGYEVGTDTMLGDTWTWNGTSWTQLTPPSSPSPRSYHAMTYDAERERVVLFGGFDTAVNDETWTWDGTSWNKETPATSPSARIAHSLAYDAHRKRAVLFGGFDGVGVRNEEGAPEMVISIHRVPSHFQVSL